MQTAQQARNETGQKIFEISKARRGGGAYCQLGEMEHVTEESSGAGEAMSRYDAGREFLSERQEVLKGTVEDKIRLQRRATEKYYEQTF